MPIGSAVCSFRMISQLLGRGRLQPNNRSNTIVMLFTPISGTTRENKRSVKGIIHSTDDKQYFIKGIKFI